MKTKIAAVCLVAVSALTFAAPAEARQDSGWGCGGACRTR